MLVESILIGIPIPIIYLCEENEGIYSVIDGQQRITTISLIKLWANIENVDKEKGCGLLFAHELSFRHIKQNYEYIKRWFNSIPENRRIDFVSYLDKCCELADDYSDKIAHFEIPQIVNDFGE